MLRRPLIFMLILTLFLSGCATNSQVAYRNVEDPSRPGYWESQGRSTSSFGEWLDEHPGVKIAGIVSLVVVGVAGLAVLVIAAGQASLVRGL